MNNISQHSFVPLAFINGYYNDNKVLTEYPTVTSSDFISVDNCNVCVFFRRVNNALNGGIARFFDGDSLSYRLSLHPVSQYPYIFAFSPASDMELVVSYGIPSGLVDFLVYDDPDAQPVLMRLGSLNDLNEEEEIG